VVGPFHLGLLWSSCPWRELPNGQWVDEERKKENNIQISKLIPRFRKLIMEILVAVIIGKIS
jgi:hypothetical protein